MQIFFFIATNAWFSILARRCDSQIDDMSLCALSHKYWGFISKTIRCWTRLQLLFSATSKAHSAHSALCSCGFVSYISASRIMLTLTSDSDFTVCGAPNDLWVGSVIKFWHGAGCHCASKCTDNFFGTEGRTAETIHWVDKCVEKEGLLWHLV